MPRKLLLTLIVIIMLFVITGCDNNKNSNGKTTSNEITIDGEKIKIDKKANLKDLTYTYSDKLDVESQRVGVFLTYTKDNPQFRISLTYAENSSLEDSIKILSVEEDSQVKVNGKIWNTYKRTDDNGIYKVFAYEYKNTTYIISFVKLPNSDIDLSDLINAFMNNIEYN